MARWDHLRLMALTGCSTCINASGFTKKLFRERFWKKGFLGNSFHKTLLNGEGCFHKRRGRQFCIIKLVFEERLFLKRAFETNVNQVQNSF